MEEEEEEEDMEQEGVVASVLTRRLAWINSYEGQPELEEFSGEGGVG
jgi:hypothetical protein